jgi:ubiquinone/menaquinone biosynthesis C-methylase UbiE
MSNDMHTPFAVEEISYPRFASFYNWMMARAVVRRLFASLRQATAGQAHGVVLEVGAGGQNFPFYNPARVIRMEAIEPDTTMLAVARQALAAAPVPISLSRAAVETIPFPDAFFDTAVVTLVFCSRPTAWLGRAVAGSQARRQRILA